jgi:transcriptional regulator of acetoin/glycerol metabolism
MSKRNGTLNVLDEARKEKMREVLEANNWEIARTAMALRIPRSTAERLARRFGLMKRANVTVERLVKA